MRKAVASSSSIRQIISKLGLVPAGGNYAQMWRYIKAFEIDTSHLKGHAWNKGMTGTFRAARALEQVLVHGTFVQSFTLKRRLIAAASSPPVAKSVDGRGGQLRDTFPSKFIT